MTSISELYTLLIHGGTVSDPRYVTGAQLSLMKQIVGMGGSHLDSGATALEVVVNAVAQMEDSGLFDAGKGSYLNLAGYAETDASLMVGHTGETGAAAVIRYIRDHGPGMI